MLECNKKLKSYDFFEVTEVGSNVFKNVKPVNKFKLVEELIKNRNRKNLNKLREFRNNILQSTDKYVLIDYPLSEENKKLYFDYRKELRDLPKKLEDQHIDLNNLNQ